MIIMLKDVRLAFPNLWKMSAPAGVGGQGPGQLAFSASFILPRNHAQIAEIEKAIAAAAREKWGAKAEPMLRALKQADKVCLHNGDLKAQYDGFEGNLYVSTRTQKRPSVFDNTKDPATSEWVALKEEDGKPYAGCYVNASVAIWAQENGFGKRVNAELRGVQFLRDGDRFGGGAGAAGSDEFSDDIAVDDDGDELTA